MEELDFKISSNLKNIIGKELITDDFIAIFELVKNSYDANATSVKIIFENIKEENIEKGPRILVLDDGDGMSLEDLKEKWLFVGYSEKKDSDKEQDNSQKNFRDKIQQKRVFAGAKGIGRFSCDRLGSELYLLTKKQNENHYNKLYTNWKKFEQNSKEEFQTIKVDYNKQQNLDDDDYDNIPSFEKGTLLDIYQLNATWDRDKLLKLKRYLQRLINPIETGEIPEFEIFLEAREFIREDEKNKSKGDFEVINGPVKNILFEQLGIKTTQINCRIDKTGDKIISELYDKGEFLFRVEENNEYPLLKNINIKLFFLNKAAKSAFTRLMGIHSIRYGSIFLYKNQFRIHPYGDEGDDWLGLDLRKSQGYARYLATRELMGRIELHGYQPDFIEVSSRDGGVIQTKEFAQLKQFFKIKALRRLEKFVIEGMDWDKSNSNADISLINDIIGNVDYPNIKLEFNENLLNLVEEKEVEKIPQVIKNIEQIKNTVESPQQKKYIESQIKSLKNSTRLSEQKRKESEKEIKKIKKDVQEIEEENIFLKSITTQDKEEIISLNHQIGISTSIMNNNLDDLKYRIQNNEKITNEDLIKLIEKNTFEIKKITTVIRYVTKANFDLKRSEVEIDLVSFIKQYIENVFIQLKEIAVDHRDVSIKVRIPKKFKAVCLVKPLEFAIIIDNLINNSIKSRAKNINITINQAGINGIELIFKDDGRGIPSSNVDKIFNFGFTTTNGSGIGLFHVQKIVEKIHGSITLTETNESGTTFVIKINELKVKK